MMATRAKPIVALRTCADAIAIRLGQRRPAPWRALSKPRMHTLGERKRHQPARHAGRICEHGSSRVIAEVNDYPFKRATLEREFVRQLHVAMDKVLIVLASAMTSESPDACFALAAVELHVAPQAVPQC